MRQLIARADRDKLRNAQERLTSVGVPDPR
jgi:hypothetical protein